MTRNGGRSIPLIRPGPSLLLALALSAPVATAQTLPVDVEIGHRWTDVRGNRDLYRTQIDEEDGLLLRALTIASNDLGAHASLIDHFRLDVDEAGAGPASSLRFEAGLASTYVLHLRYRRTEAFSALPTFANPLLGAGVLPGQHTFDRTRDLLDADVELLRWSAVKPFVGYTWNRYEGPGTTTWHLGQDEFLLSQNLRDTDRELRIGAAFELGPVQGQVTQGWRRFRGHEALTLAPGAGGGNNAAPVIGKPIVAGALTRDERTDVDTPFTSLYVAGQATPRIRLTGNFARFAAESDSDAADAATGTFAAFAPLNRFFGGLTEQSSGRVKNTTWRGGARADVTLNDQADFTAGYRREHRELDGSALIDTLYLQTVTFGGVDPRDVEAILRSSNALERQEDVVDAGVTVRPIGPLLFRVGASQSSLDVTVTPDLSEIVIDGGQGGTFGRRVRSLLVDGSYARSGLMVSASVRRDRANDPVLRTDYLDRDRVRIRAAWKAPKFFRAGISADQTTQANDRSGIGYDAKIRQFTADIAVTPTDALSLRASASRFRSNSNILFLRPENLAPDESVHVERGQSREGGLGYAWRRLTFDGDLSRFENAGSLPFRLDRAHARATFQLFPHFGLGAEWARDQYRESSFALADYAASRYGLFLRVTR